MTLLQIPWWIPPSFSNSAGVSGVPIVVLGVRQFNRLAENSGPLLAADSVGRPGPRKISESA